MAELTVAADLAWRIAALEAQRGRAGAISPEHLLIGLLSLEKLLDESAGLTPAQRDAVRGEQAALTGVLGAAGLDAADARRALRAALPTGPAGAGPEMQRDPACRAAFERAEVLARQHRRAACGVLDLLAALLERPSAALAAALGEPDRVRGRLDAALTAGDAPAAVTAAAATPEPGQVARLEQPAPSTAPASPAVPPVLLRYGRDLTAEAEAGRLPPVVGRHDEMLQLARVLHRRIKNSPVLIGEAGVGKTAVVEGLARRIAEGAVLPGRRIVALNLASVVAGTTYRGQFEERLEEILAALRARPELILFLDELHTIVGAGDADGRLDAASILKPALSRGEIACIGATTLDEYRRHIETDPALERRFQPIVVHEPSPAETLAILEGLRLELERHHGVRIEAGALEAAVELTVRHLASRRLPDKAVDALDEACALARVPTLTVPPDQPGTPEAAPAVTGETVAAVVSGWAGISLGQPWPAEAAMLADLETRLAERIVGQAEAIRRLAERVRLARAGLTDPERPAGVFLLLGPSGTGKTALALALAELLAAGPDGDGGPAEQAGLIRLDLAEYAEPRQAARLIGSAPGYGGREQDGLLTGRLRRNPRAVVLLDEVEKAHPELLDLLLPLLGSGRLADARGRVVDGRQAFFVLTANLAVGAAGRRPVGFRQAGAGDAAGGDGSTAVPGRATLLAELHATVRPELLQRIDEIVLLRPLGEDDLLEIARRQVHQLQARLLEQHGVTLTVAPATLALLARRAAAGSGGAREVERAITRLLAEPLSRELLAGRLQRGGRLLAEPRGDDLAFAPAPESS
jgi:ATP-dependent Clp protease ATP-binding subunit ClpC